MPDLADKHEIWGTFSVMDHRRRGAFIAEVVLYDRLVIPVPPDPKKAKTDEDKAFASKQWERWLDEKWKPVRQRKLLKIIEPVVERIEWDRQHHALWAQQFETYTRSRSTDAAQMLGRMMAGWVTGQVLLDDLPAKAQGAVAVAPFGTLEELEDELGIEETHTLPERMRASSGLPGELVSAIVGREFLVPTDHNWSELDLLKEAVDLAATPEYRQARRAFHTAMLGFVRDRHTDYDSIKGAVEAMDAHLAELDKLARKRKRWRRADQALFFSQILLDVAAAPTAPVTLGHAAVALGQFTASGKLGNPADPHAQGAAGALLYHAQPRLGLDRKGNVRPPTRLERLKATVFGDGAAGGGSSRRSPSKAPV